MDRRLPFPALLSQALVAFTIEFDNEAERQMIHRTTTGGGSLRHPWLVSLVMWSNCLRFVGDDGVPLDCLPQLARTTTNVAGMQRWGYITVEPDPASKRTKIVRATPGGRRAQEILRPLFGEIEQRWRERLGKSAFDELRGALWGLVSQLDPNLPDCLPILNYGLFSQPPTIQKRRGGVPCGTAVPESTLPALLSKVLLAFALEFESQSEVSIAIGANVLRLAGADKVQVCDLPALSGVSKEGIAIAVNYLRRHGYASLEPESVSSRRKVLTLTSKGEKARETYDRLLNKIENRWQATFGIQTIERIGESLERLDREVLFRVLTPSPEGWRASRPERQVLPYYPMVSHRGGYPDGS